MMIDGITAFGLEIGLLRVWQRVHTHQPPLSSLNLPRLDRGARFLPYLTLLNCILYLYASAPNVLHI